MAVIFFIITGLIELAFIISVPWALWLSFRHHKKVAAALISLYIIMAILAHAIDQSDNTYSDVSHGLFGNWNVPLFGLCLLAVFVLQVREIASYLKNRKTKAPKRSR